MSDLRSAARGLYERHLASLGLDPWRPGPWRDEAPTPAQVRTLTRVAGTSLAGLDDDAREVVRAVAIAPQRAGRGACSDVQAVALTAYQRATGADAAPTTRHPPGPSRRPPGPREAAPRRPPAPAAPTRDARGGLHDAPAVRERAAEVLRMAILRAVAEADGDTLERIGRVLWA